VGEVCGRELQWEARITEQVPGEAIAWRSEGRLLNAGRVTFEPLGPEKTRVSLRVEHDPHDLAEALSRKLGSDLEELRGDLETFKELVEEAEAERLAPATA